MKLEFIDSQGNPQTLADSEIAVDAHEGENRFWVSPVLIAGISEDTRLVLINSIEGGGSVSIPVLAKVVHD
jgi:hypothetical protein